MLQPVVSWVPIEGYPHYAVNQFGEVVNLKTDRILRPRSNGERGGEYLRVALSHEGKVVDHYIAQLVAKAFFHNWRDDMRVTHVNGDKSNNAARNLRLKHGVLDRVERYVAKPGWGRQVIVRETGRIYRTVRDCARHIGGDYSAIYSCLRGERGSHLGYTFQYIEEGEETDELYET